MARCFITNKKKLKKLSDLIGVEIETATVRGGTNHRIDAYGKNNVKYNVWPDGKFNAEE